MANFKSTKFIFTTKQSEPLHITNVMTYGVDGWEPLSVGLPPQGMENQGIGWLDYYSKEISETSNGALSVMIDSEIVNNVPYASDKASLLISVDGSNLHIDIHKGGGMKATGTFGNKSVKFDCDFNDTGEVSYIECTPAK